MRAALYTAAWVLPVTAAPLRDGAVLVNEHGIIDTVAPADTFNVSNDVARIELGDAVLLPGLVNVHTHPELAGMRGLLEDLPFHQWIPTLRRVKNGAALEQADFAAAARWTLLECIAAGITTIGATEDSGAALEALREAGMRGVVYREVFAPAAENAATALQQLRERVAAMRELETPYVRVGVSPHAPYTVSDELFQLVASLAHAETLPVAVHAAESEAEELLVTAGSGAFAAGLRTRGIATPARAESTIALLERTGILATQPLLIHCVRVSAADIACIAKHGAIVAHCPTANARLGHGIAPVVELLEADVTVALGSDSVASNNRIDMLEEARTAQLLQRARYVSAGALPADRLLRLITIDGARALGLDQSTGSLEPGKLADLCAVRLAGVHAQPVHEPHAALLMSTRGADVTLTVAGGVVLYREGSFYTLTTAAVRARLEDAAARMRAARDQPA